MIEEFKSVGTHADQRREGLIRALKEAGIGSAYADRKLEDAGDQGVQLRDWMIANRDRIKEGYGFDFRGVGAPAVTLVNLVGRGLMTMGIHVHVLPLVKLAATLNAADGEAEIMAVQHLVIRDFETDRENPLRAYEVAKLEALIEDRLSDCRAVTVVRRKRAGWWSDTTEDLIAQNSRTIEIA